MAFDHDAAERVERFLDGSAFSHRGGVVTDLDGTAVHEHRGRIVIPRSVEHGLKRLHELGRPIMLNTLRFPLSVLRTFGHEWCDVTGAPIPVACCNGAVLGRVGRDQRGDVGFDEISATPMTSAEIDAALSGVEALVRAGFGEALVFAYPRDWRMGELVWTPRPERVQHVRDKYRSASAVSAVDFAKWRAQLQGEDCCMLFVLVDAPHDRLMAYQHAQRDAFFTHAGVDKLSGARRLAQALGVDLAESVGAGDTAMDKFLAGCGLAVVVGAGEVPWKGLRDTLRLPDSPALGELLFRLAGLHAAARP